MTSLPKNIRVGRNGRIGILKKIPRDLWQHPRYANRAKIIERSTGIMDLAQGTRAAQEMLNQIEK